jgi:hypothetical protein
MIAKNCSVEDLKQALKETNISFKNNVEFNRSPEPRGKNLIFTLKVKDSKKPGHRLGFENAEGKQRRMAYACWHVHGTFFDELLNINPEAIICTWAGNKNQIYSTGRDKNGAAIVFGNWEDPNIGSVYNPLYFSEACECD